MRLLALIGVLLLSLQILSTSARAAEVRCTSGRQYNLKQNDEWFIRRWPSGVRPTRNTCAEGFIYGEIAKGDYDKVVDLYRENHPFIYGFSIASPGGDVAEAMKIGRLFKRYLLNVSSPLHMKERTKGGEFEYSLPPTNEPECDIGHYCVCASARAIIWFGGVERFGTVGLHRPRTDDPLFRALAPNQAAEVYTRVLAEIRRYLDEMEVPKPLIETMVATSSADIKWVDHDDLRRPPSLAEWEDANCGSSSEKDGKLLSILSRKGKLSHDEQIARDRLENRKQCLIELLFKHRDRLNPP